LWNGAQPPSGALQGLISTAPNIGQSTDKLASYLTHLKSMVNTLKFHPGLGELFLLVLSFDSIIAIGNKLPLFYQNSPSIFDLKKRRHCGRRETKVEEELFHV
jgi:hypothetical protein